MRIWKSVDKLVEGDIAEEEIALAAGKAVVRVGERLTEDKIGLLKSLGIKWLLVDTTHIDGDIKGILHENFVSNMKQDIEDIFTKVVEDGKIEYSKVEERAKTLSKNIMDNYGDYIVPVMAILKNLDEYTYTHEVNVAILSTLMGIELGLKEETMHTLATSALIHDVGKLMVPQEILNARRKLSNLEFTEVKKHVVYGKQICEESGLKDRAILAGIEEHHEKMDGTGYMRGLKNGSIDLFARIIAVADIYDALTSERPYKPGWTPYKAFSFILSIAGKHLDPRVVNGLIKVMGMYPAGTRLLLSNGREVVVVGIKRGYYTRPLVQDEEGNVIDLGQEKKLKIEKVLG